MKDELPPDRLEGRRDIPKIVQELRKETREKRKLLAARLSLANKISEIAARRGTLYDYVNDVLEQAVRAESLGLTLKEILDDRLLLKTAKDAGFSTFPEKIFYELVERGYERLGKQWMSNLWYETGEWYGRYCEDLATFEDAVNKFFWDVSDFKVSQEGEYLTVTCLSSKFSEVYTSLFSRFLEGALKVLGYDLVEGDVSKGIIRLKFVKSKGE